MRYLGNKQSLLDDIDSLLVQNHLYDKQLVFFDAFCGTGSVADHYKSRYEIIVNDNLKFAEVYAKGKIVRGYSSEDLYI